MSRGSFPKAPLGSVSLRADLGGEQDLLQKNGPVSIWNGAPSPPQLPFPTSQVSWKVCFWKSHGVGGLICFFFSAGHKGRCSSFTDQEIGNLSSALLLEKGNPSFSTLGGGERKAKGIRVVPALRKQWKLSVPVIPTHCWTDMRWVSMTRNPLGASQSLQSQPA